MRKKIPVEADIPLSVDGCDPLCNDTASIVSMRRIDGYLDGLLGRGYDLIVTTPRKGSWIIDSFMKKKGLSIPHAPFSDDQHRIDADGLDVLVFDDSVHTGDSVLRAVSAISNAKNITVGCILINKEAKELLEKDVRISNPIRYREIFERYTGKNPDGYLSDDCQQYRYAYCLIPYIHHLSENRSPDFSSMVITIPDSTADMKGVASAILERIDLSSEPYTVDSVPGRLRISAEIDQQSIKSIIDGMTISSMDQCKIRISCSDYGTWKECTVTPMICPVTVDGSPNIGIILSGKFLDAFGDGILESIRPIAGNNIRAMRFDGVRELGSWSSGRSDRLPPGSHRYPGVF